MKNHSANRCGGVLLWGSLFGLFLCIVLSETWSDRHVADAKQNDSHQGVDLAALQHDVNVLKDKATDQSHVMSDVAYHFTNLWFAAKAQNWPLAEFYWKETRSHMHWAVRVIPVRKDSAGREIKLEDILQSIEQTPYTQLGKTIKEKKIEGFEKAYRFTLVGCYSCHKASGKPYLRPQIPERPATTIINFDPNATWPE